MTHWIQLLSPSSLEGLAPICLAGLLVAMSGCGLGPMSRSDGDEARHARARGDMVERQLVVRDITDPDVLAAMRSVPRHLFVPTEIADQAYRDSPLAIGHGQTISQPYVVALMTQLARASGGKRALDVGTGSGYQAAVLAEICDDVFSIEILCVLADEAEERLDRLGYENVVVRCGDGYAGWEEQAPFDLIVVAAAPTRVPQPLIDQLAPGGRLVIPVGDVHQELVVIERAEDGTVRRMTAGGVRFVPMLGEAEKGR